MPTGKIKFFNTEKGFGFITQDQGGDDMFVHISACGGTAPNEGDKVRYEIGQDRRTGRPRAENVDIV